MEFKPHDYQQYAIEYIETHEIAAILLDMGLGKTAITLTALYDLLFDYFEITRVLVIAPLRVARNTWPQEIEKWDHLKDVRYSVAVGTEKERLEAFRRDADIYIINRENVQWMVENVPFEFDAIVVDELSSFKNWNSKRFKSLMKVRPRAKRVIGLTGTPSGNGLMDLFAEFKVLDMGQRLGRFITKYRQDYFRPDRMNGQVVYSYKPLPGAEKRIYDKISDITISMKAADHLKMPELINSEYRVYMDEPERAIYDEMCEDLAAQLDKGEVTAANAGVLSGKLCQMANGAVYTDDGDVEYIHDQKLDALEDIIESMNGKPLLVAYWYQHDLDRIEDRLRMRKCATIQTATLLHTTSRWLTVPYSPSIKIWRSLPSQTIFLTISLIKVRFSSIVSVWKLSLKLDNAVDSISTWISLSAMMFTSLCRRAFSSFMEASSLSSSVILAFTRSMNAAPKLPCDSVLIRLSISLLHFLILSSMTATGLFCVCPCKSRFSFSSSL